MPGVPGAGGIRSWIRTWVGRVAARPAAVAAIQVAWVALFWGKTLEVGILSDGYYILAHASRGLPEALAWDGSYHFYPVTNAYFALLYPLFGLWAPGYQALALLQLCACGFLLYLLGRRLLGDARWALLGSLLFLGNSSYYEVPAWPINGNLHTLSALLYLAGLHLLLRALDSDRRLAYGIGFGALVLVAFFTYEPTFTLAPVGFLLVLLRRPDLFRVGGVKGGIGRWLPRRSSLTALGRLFAPTVVAGLLALGSKVYFLSRGLTVTNTPEDYWFSAFLLVRAALAILTLCAPDHLLFRFFSLGIEVHGGSGAFKALVGGWLALLAVLLAAALWRTRSKSMRFLLLWLAGHLLLVHLATGLVSRHFLIPAMPAALLVAGALAHAIRRASGAGVAGGPGPGPARRLGRRRLGRLAAPLAAVALLVLFAASHRYARRATRLHVEATAASESVTVAVAAGMAERRGARHLLLLNMAAILDRQGLGAYAFVNGLHQQVAFRFPGAFARVDLGFTPRLGARGQMANGSRLVPLSEVTRKVENPAWIVVLFDRETARARFVEEAYW